ncbi:ABC transporter permease [Nesterenkonia flava]|uniref:ABC transporter permease subunit n=1 Tax=Nesterenkonia flava TaxID=469799 RepID=A0ABU1FV09_9MICC|nr:ABC transporter permease subunit [Nesterenkonia flava]MDR5712499.1 ABC transporter permease subunit [Nesterenkonia flava]
MSAAPVVETSRAGQAGTLGLLLAKTLGSWAMILGIITVLWIGLLWAFDVSDFVGKGPVDVFEYLFREEGSAEARAEIWSLSMVTVRDAAVGFVAGMAAAVALAVFIVLSRVMEAAIMPLAMIVRSVPLVALAPIIILAVGRGTAVVAVMGGIVVLFPALVTIVFGLRSVTPQIRDVVTVYGGGTWDVLLKVAFPSALPAFFSAVRISVPGAFTGALLAQWLATGEGIGSAVVSAVSRSQNTRVWALVVVITLVSLLIYMVAQLVENLVLRHYDMAQKA